MCSVTLHVIKTLNYITTSCWSSNYNTSLAEFQRVCLCRWVKFEEKVEEGGERWSKPHVSTLTLHSLFELRTCLQTGSILLDLDGYSLPQIVGETKNQHADA